MRHVLAAESRVVLTRFASLSALYAFDFDGTLAPFVADAKNARMRARTSGLFGELARARPCAVISGRARDDLRLRLGGAPIEALVGNHGIEPQDTQDMDASFVDTMRQVRAAVMHELEELDGVFVEDKRFTLAVHYRHAPHAAKARAAIHEILGAVADIRVLGGELVVNIIPKGAPHKGDALVGLLAQRGIAAAFYLGDDETDEDVFRLQGQPEIFKVRVGYSTTTSADYFLEHQSEIDLLLEVLLAGSPCARSTTR